MAIWLRTLEGDRYRLIQQADETEEEVMQAIVDGTFPNWAPVSTGHEGGWKLVNLARVLWIETAPDDAQSAGFE
jgi:hypothetical protein